MGFLKYRIDALEEGYSEDIIIVPVATNYDRIVEENSYHKELKGKKKEAESTSAFFQSRRFLKRKHGKVYFAINEPLSLNELKTTYHDSENATRDVAYEVIKKVNNIIMVTPFSLVTSAMLYSGGRGFSKEFLHDRVTDIYNYLSFMGTGMSDELSSPQGISDVIDYVITSYMEDAIVSELNLEGINREENSVRDIMYVLNDDERTRINFYKNTILHYMLPLAFASISLACLSRNMQISREKYMEGCRFVYELFTREFIYSGIMEDIDAMADRALDYLQSIEAVTVSGKTLKIQEKSYKLITFFARSLQDFFESYLIVLSYILKSKKKSMLRKDLINEIRKRGIRMYHQGYVKLAESLSISNYNNALSILVDLNVLNEQEKGKKQVEVLITDLSKARELRDRILGYIAEINTPKALAANSRYVVSSDGKDGSVDSDLVH